LTSGLPNLQYIPTKYHAYVLPPIRKLYLSKPASSSPAQIQAEAQITALQAQIKSLSTSNAHLAQRCSLQKVALGTLAEAVRETKAELVAAELEVENARKNAERVRVDVEKTRVESREVREALEDMTSRYAELKETMVIRYVDKCD
jgi:chromosome segregation ATPase